MIMVPDVSAATAPPKADLLFAVAVGLHSKSELCRRLYDGPEYSSAAYSVLAPDGESAERRARKYVRNSFQRAGVLEETDFAILHTASVEVPAAFIDAVSGQLQTDPESVPNRASGSDLLAACERLLESVDGLWRDNRLSRNYDTPTTIREGLFSELQALRKAVSEGREATGI